MAGPVLADVAAPAPRLPSDVRVAPPSDDPTWWRSAVIYQVYVRSFADANGDGTGDLAGVRSRLPYLRDLGIDAIWFTPWYLSPLADGGYDVADYRAIDPAFGTLEEAEALIADALDHGIRTIIDVVPNHVSDRHAWFQAALAAGPGSPERERFWFRPGSRRGRRRAADRLALGVQGRPDVDPHDEPGRHTRRLVPPPLHRRAARPELGPSGGPGGARGDPALLVRPRRRGRADRLRGPAGQGPGDAGGPGRPGARATIRSTTATSSTTSTARWRAVADALSGRRASWSARSGSQDIERFARYLRPDELHTAFNFDFMARPVGRRRACVRRSTRRSPPMPRSAPRPHGSCRTTTSPGRSPATAARTRPSPSPASGSGPRRMSSSVDVGHGPPRSSPPPCPARCTSTRATSWASTRWRSRATRSRTRCTPGLAAIDPGRDGCRVPLPWSGRPPRSGSARPTPRPRRG